jgi:hypothetical protein
MRRNWKIVFDWSVEIWFRIEKDKDGYPRSKSWEQLLGWPVRERDDYFSIESIPFFVKGISRGDIVLAKVTHNSEVQEGEFFEFGQPTHPYNIHEILVGYQHIDPGYKFVV